MANCTYRFTDAGGNKRVIEGQAAFKAYLASGGLEYLLPGAAVSLSAKQKEPIYTHVVVDPQNNNKVMGRYQSASAARLGRDKLDNKYGGYRYQVQTIETGEPAFSQRVPKLEPKDVLKPSTLAAAEAAIAKYKKAETPDTLTAKQRADGAATLQPLFDAATRNKADFDNTLDQIAEGLGGYAKKPGIKSVARAVTKLITENGNDPTTIKDLLRGTIAVNTFQEAQEAINQIGKVYSFDRIKNRLAVDLTSPDGAVLEGVPLSTGYQDILTNVTLEDG